MRDELDRLRLAVDEATTQVIAATDDFEVALAAERYAASVRDEAQTRRDATLQRLADARAALDASLGIAPTVRAVVPLSRPATPPPVYEDDDEPIRDP